VPPFFLEAPGHLMHSLARLLVPHDVSDFAVRHRSG
jgi:hypothetical protein